MKTKNVLFLDKLCGMKNMKYRKSKRIEE